MRSIRGSKKGWQALTSKKSKTKKVMKCYEKRKDRLSILGYSGYQQYLQSEDWKKIRDHKIRQYPTCILCNAKATEVHHLGYDYETLLGMKSYRLVQLCRDCHESIEIDGDRKRDLREANKVLFEKASCCDRGRNWIRWIEEQKKSFKRARRRRNRRNKD